MGLFTIQTIIITHSYIGFDMSAAEIWPSVTDIITIIIGGVIAVGISFMTTAWKIRNHDNKRRIEAHTGLLRVLEVANKKLTDNAGLKKTLWTHFFTTTDHERFIKQMEDPLISDAVHESYKASKPILSSTPNKHGAAMHLATLSNLQDTVVEEISRLKRKGRGCFFMCKRNPARQTEHAT